LERLAKDTRYTVALGVLDGSEVLVVDLLPGTANGQRMEAEAQQSGSWLPVYCTAIGKVLLAHLSGDRQSALIAELELEGRGPKAVTSKQRLMEQLAQVPEEGIAVSDEELLAGTCAIAAPIRDESGDVVAGVSVIAQNGAIELDDLVARFAGGLVATAQRISTRLGWPKVGE
jgi:IclR family pca regulon transcriptional regulator